MSDTPIAKPERPLHWARALVDSNMDRMAKADAPSTALGSVRAHAEGTAGHAIVSGGLGAVFGLADAVVGPEPGGFATDGLVGLLSFLGAWGLGESSPGFAKYLCTTGAVGLSGFTRRRTSEAVTSLLGGGRKRDGGERSDEDRGTPNVSSSTPRTPDEDPIVKFARERSA